MACLAASSFDDHNSRDEWERTFNICWGGVYNCTRAFLPMLQNAEEGHIVNTSSINGFWASVGGSELADELAIGIELSKSYLGGGTITARDLDLTRLVTPNAPAKCLQEPIVGSRIPECPCGSGA